MGANGAVARNAPHRHRDDVVTLPHQRVAALLLRYIEVCGVVLIFFVLMRAILPLLLHGSADDVNRSDPSWLVERVAYWFFYAFVAAQMILRPWDLVRAASRSPFAVAVVLLALLSASWSLDPTMTVRRTFTLGMITVFGLYLAIRFRPADLARLLAVVMGASAVLSLGFGLFLPSYGIAHEVNVGAWQGIYAQKNLLGQAMLFAALIFQSVPSRSQRSRVLGWTGFALAVVLIVLSQSLTAFLCLIAVSTAIPLLRRFRQRRVLVALVLGAACVLFTAVLLMSVDLDAALGIVGKEKTLTGRTGMWAAMMDQIVERPLLGHGYAVFWLRAPGPGETVRQVIQWATPNGHNAYLDAAAELGVVGMLLVLGTIGQAWHRTWQRWRPQLDPSDEWLLRLLLGIILISFVQSPLSVGSYLWALVVAGAAAERRM